MRPIRGISLVHERCIASWWYIYKRWLLTNIKIKRVICDNNRRDLYLPVVNANVTILPFISIGQTKYLFYDFEKKYSVFIIHESLWLECNDKYWVFLRESLENRYFVWPILIKCLLQILSQDLVRDRGNECTRMHSELA